MAGGIRQLINNVKRLDVKDVIKEAVVKSEPKLLELQKKQWLRGETSITGTKIGKYRSGKYYKRKKFNMNSLAGYGNVDLRLTGEFHRNTKIFFFDTSFFFKSTDWKHEKLTKDYGERIYGLNSKSIREVTKDGSFRVNVVSEFKKRILK
jgi:hypothetical protein